MSRVRCWMTSSPVGEAHLARPCCRRWNLHIALSGPVRWTESVGKAVARCRLAFPSRGDFLLLHESSIISRQLPRTLVVRSAPSLRIDPHGSTLRVEPVLSSTSWIRTRETGMLATHPPSRAPTGLFWTKQGSLATPGAQPRFDRERVPHADPVEY